MLAPGATADDDMQIWARREAADDDAMARYFCIFGLRGQPWMTTQWLDTNADLGSEGNRR